jgi:Methyltransferase domain
MGAVTSQDSFPWLKAALAIVVTNVVTLTLCRQYHAVASWFPFDDSKSKGESTRVTSLSSFHHDNHLLLSTTNSVNDLPSPSTTLAFQHSLGFFDDIEDDVWVNVYQGYFRSTPHYLNPQNPNADVYKGHNTAYWQYYNWIPNFSCP